MPVTLNIELILFMFGLINVFEIDVRDITWDLI